MNSILHRQRSAEALRLQAAFKATYRRAKFARRVVVAGNVLFGVAGPIFILFQPMALPTLGALAGLWLFIGRAVISPLQHRLTGRGALIQEQFDVEVLGLPWNSSLGIPVAAEEVAAAARRGETDPQPWYPTVSDPEPTRAVLICQRANVVWARRQHEAYSWVVVALATLLFVGGIIVSVLQGVLLSLYLTTVALPSLPALVDAIDVARANQQAHRRRENIERAIERLLVQGQPESEAARWIQDQIFELRRTAPLVPEWFYRLLRPRFERDMQEAATRLSGGEA